MNEKRNNLKLLWLIPLGVIILILFFGFFYTVHAGEKGILLTWGKPDSVPKDPGLHFKLPIIQSVVKFDVKTQKYEAKASAASKDLQTVTTDVAVNFHLQEGSVVEMYKTVGINYQDKLIQPAVQESVKAVTAGYTAEELITHRQIVKDAIDTALRDRLIKYNIVVETISITNFDFSESFNQAIEAKVTAEQNALAAKNKLEQVKYEAEQRITQATAEATAIRIQAESINKVGGKDYIQLQAINKWDGRLPQVSGTATPFIDINALMQRTA